MDMEMTGLDPLKDKVLEIATLITNNELDIIATGPQLVIRHQESTLEAMDNWNQEHHSKSGLWQRVVDSEISLKQAEDLTYEFIKPYTVEGKNCLAGNTIWQDRRFLIHHMPRIHRHLHYRLIDVSSLKELASRWYPHIKPNPKKNAHRAMDDILESLDELKYYKSCLFRET